MSSVHDSAVGEGDGANVGVCDGVPVGASVLRQMPKDVPSF